MQNLAIQKEDVMESNNTSDFQKFAAQKIYLWGSLQLLLLWFVGFHLVVSIKSRLNTGIKFRDVQALLWRAMSQTIFLYNPYDMHQVLLHLWYTLIYINLHVRITVKRELITEMME
jgi:hypothetical protein